MAISPTSDVRQMIGQLIEVCRDTQHGFELAARGVAQEPILRAEFLQYSGQRQEFVADLNDALRRAGEPPIPQTSPTTDLIPSTPAANAASASPDDAEFAPLERAVAAHDRVAILTECERAEAAAADAYRRAAVGLPPLISGAVAVQLHAINRVHDRVQSLLDVATADAGDN